MNFKTTKEFDRETKRLSKKYPSLAADIRNLRAELNENPFKGSPLGEIHTKSEWQSPQKVKVKAVGQESSPA